MRRLGLAALLGLLLNSPATAQIADPSTAEHVTISPGIESWFYLKRDDLSVVRMRIAPGASEDLHLHRRARLYITMLTGTLTVEIGGKEHVVTQAQGIEIPPGTPHRARNTTATPIDLMVVAMPPSAGDREAVAR
jgi:mannose-6-phosphate isomerase-like protein (cupin superfamily)